MLNNFILIKLLKNLSQTRALMPFSHRQQFGPAWQKHNHLHCMQLSTATLSTSHLYRELFSVSAVDIDDAVAVSTLRQVWCIMW